MPRIQAKKVWEGHTPRLRTQAKRFWEGHGFSRAAESYKILRASAPGGFPPSAG